MKLKNIVSLASLSLLLGVASCNVLDTQPFETYDEATVWGSKSTADAFVTGTISNVMYGYVNGNQTTWEERTGNAVHSNGGIGFVREQIDRYSDDGGLGDFGNIRRCNLIIEKAAEYTGQGLSDADSKDLIAKGKLLRALLYYRQARTMGRFVWVDRVLAPADTASNGMMMPTTKTTTESYTYILNDLDAAIPDLPTSVKAGELGEVKVRLPEDYVWQEDFDSSTGMVLFEKENPEGGVDLSVSYKLRSKEEFPDMVEMEEESALSREKTRRESAEGKGVFESSGIRTKKVGDLDVSYIMFYDNLDDTSIHEIDYYAWAPIGDSYLLLVEVSHADNKAKELMIDKEGVILDTVFADIKY